jgi:hypothetical protein
VCGPAVAEVPEALARSVIESVARLRAVDLAKRPGIAEAIWALAPELLGAVGADGTPLTRRSAWPARRRPGAPPRRWRPATWLGPGGWTLVSRSEEIPVYAYKPLAGGVQAALPYFDVFVSEQNLASLETSHWRSEWLRSRGQQRLPLPHVPRCPHAPVERQRRMQLLVGLRAAALQHELLGGAQVVEGGRRQRAHLVVDLGGPTQITRRDCPHRTQRPNADATHIR